MPSGAILISAPYDARANRRACVDWAEHQLFQPLFGFDAQMAAFAAYAGANGTSIQVLAAPEIFASAEPLAAEHQPGRPRGERGPIVHVRFGPVRAPRILKGAVNIVMAAEEPMPPLDAGFHPFASGTAVPQAVELVLSFRRPQVALHRVGGEAAPTAILPGSLIDADMPMVGAAFAGGWPMNTVLQSCIDFAPADWTRALPRDGLAPPPPDQPLVMIPWNLAHPGSQIPGLLENLHLLAVQGRCPVDVLVVPFNDFPAGIELLLRVVAGCREQTMHAPAHQGRIHFARALTISAGLQLASLCCRAWIDATDPEWRYTAERLRRLGLPLHVLADTLTDQTPAIGDAAFQPDEAVVIRADSAFGRLSWRARTLSLRRLAGLAAAVAAEIDAPIAALPPFFGDQGPAGAEILGLLLRTPAGKG